MEHAHHFLSRLDRLSIPHAELALSLYRDHQLLKIIIDSAKVPEGVERVALSLADPKRGPFLVITRDGHFVTCLGEGMSKGDLMVITREKLDGVATRVETLRKRIEVAGLNTGERGGVGKLFRQIYDAGPRFSREGFLIAAAWQPLLFMEYFHWMVETANEVTEAREVLVRELRRTNKLHARFHELLHSYSNSVWFIGHMAVLMALDGKQSYEDLPEKAQEAMQQMPLAWYSVRQGMVGPALRGIWGAGRMGKMLLSAYKKFYDEATTLYRVVDATCSLATIGLRHSRLAAEVEKTLHSPLPRSGEDNAYQKVLDAIVKTVAATYKITRAEREFMFPIHLKAGRSVAMNLVSDTKPGSRFKFKRPEDVPEEIAYPLLLHTADEFTKKFTNFQIMNVALPWLASVDAEQLYLPAEYFADAQLTYDPGEIMPLLLAIRDTEYRPRGETRSTPKGADRNSPCPCGSGRKYKRCCLGKTT